MKGMNSVRKREIKKLLLKRAKYKCSYCGDPVKYTTATFDHFEPRANGGTNAIVNLKIACEPCNQAKGAMTPAEWMNYLDKRATEKKAA